MTGFSTYPFRIFKPETFGYKDLPVKDTVVGHDVWIGHDAAIMPGVYRRDRRCCVGRYAQRFTLRSCWTKPGQRHSDALSHRDNQRTSRYCLVDWPVDKIEANLASLENCDLAALKMA